MYLALEAAVLALTVFVPLFIGVRDRSNSDWRSAQA